MDRRKGYSPEDFSIGLEAIRCLFPMPKLDSSPSAVASCCLNLPYLKRKGKQKMQNIQQRVFPRGHPPCLSCQTQHIKIEVVSGKRRRRRATAAECSLEIPLWIYLVTALP